MQKATIKTNLFTCYAGRSRLCVLWVSLWQWVVGRHFPEREAEKIKSMSDCLSHVRVTLEEKRVTSTEMLAAGTWVYGGM